MKTTYNYKPIKFFGIAFFITWSTWFISAFLSHNNGSEAAEGTFMGLGLLGPLVAALFMVFGSRNKDLKKDFKNKLVNCMLIKPKYLPLIILLMPAVIVVSIILSRLFGQSIDQLKLTSDFDIMIVTVVLAVISLLVIVLDKEFFFGIKEEPSRVLKSVNA